VSAEKIVERTLPSFTHKKVAHAIARIDQPPTDPGDFAQWILAGGHLAFLEANAGESERVIYASGPYAFIHSIAVPLAALEKETPEALLGWSTNPFTNIASYVSGGGRETMWIERHKEMRGSPALDAGIDLIFGRTFEGWSGEGRNYFEVNQEYTHLSGIHWRPERSAYCRFDANGDLADVVSISTHKKDGDVSLVTFSWPELEEYLAIAGFALVRCFDFTLLRHGQFSSWGDGPERTIRVSDDFLFRQKSINNAAYTRGVQIMRPRDIRTVSDEVSDRWSGRSKKEHVSFIAQDWRHENTVAEISTDPAATTNYFDAEENDLPFELSPAYFRPEVLSKYKTDREKYTVGDRDINCRAAWSLRGYDVNDAGQVFAYIVYLRSLPYSELLHWKSFNEPPKDGISKRAYINDFRGEFVLFQHPRSETISMLQRWRSLGVAWWTLRDEELLDRANPPISSSKDEWADAIMDLSKLVVEGFETMPIRAALDGRGAGYDADKDKTIVLLEKLVTSTNPTSGPVKLGGLRTVQLIRSKVRGHAGSSDGKELAQEALATHGSYAEHFRHLCTLVVNDLERVQAAFEERT
jgi:hypothetical protein